MGHIEDELDLIDFIKNNLEFSKKKNGNLKALKINMFKMC